MSSLEDRIRAGLNADRPVPELWDAVQDGARCYRERRTTGVVAAAVLAVVAVAVGMGVFVGGTQEPAPVETPKPSPTTTVGPSPNDEIVGLSNVGEALFAEFVTCTERGPAGECVQPAAARHLWRYAKGEWTDLGDLPAGVGSPFLRGSAMDWLGESQDRARVPVTRDAGATWTWVDLPEPCMRGGDCDVLLTPTQIFEASYEGDWYAAELGTDQWTKITPPKPQSPNSFFMPHVLDGGTLVAEERPRGGAYRISANGGQTWSERRALPRSGLSVYPGLRLGDGGTLYAACDYMAPCGTWRSDDLVHWQRVSSKDLLAPMPRCNRSGQAIIQSQTAVGSDTYGIFVRVYTKDGRPLPASAFGHGTADHPYAYVNRLMVSHDDCRTWTQPLADSEGVTQ